MRLKLAGDSIEEQIAELARDIEEMKTPQFTSQNSGMLARLCRASTRDSFGDIVEWTSKTYDSQGNPTSTTVQNLSRIPLPATPQTYHYNSVYCNTQVFVPKHGKPAVAVPFMRLAVKSGGLHGESEFVTNQYGGFRLQMIIYNAANQQVGDLSVAQDMGDYLEPTYNPTNKYAWKSVITYTCTVPFELSYQLLVRSSDDGSTSSKLEGLFSS